MVYYGEILIVAWYRLLDKIMSVIIYTYKTWILSVCLSVCRYLCMSVGYYRNQMDDSNKLFVWQLRMYDISAAIASNKQIISMTQGHVGPCTSMYAELLSPSSPIPRVHTLYINSYITTTTRSTLSCKGPLPPHKFEDRSHHTSLTFNKFADMTSPHFNDRFRK